MADLGYRTVLLTTINGQDVYINFDLITDESVSSSISITECPLVNGDIASDHMYREPNIVTLRGKFSLNSPFSSSNIYNPVSKGYTGSQKDNDKFKLTNPLVNNITQQNSYDRLQAIEDLFESIKNEGILCTLITYDKTKSKSRFKIRNNLCLQSISWTKSYNTLGFSFSFKEIIFVNIDETFVTDFDNTNPEVGNIKQVDFTETLLDWSQVDSVLYNVFLSTGFCSKEFLNYVVNTQQQLKDGQTIDLSNTTLEELITSGSPLTNDSRFILSDSIGLGTAVIGGLMNKLFGTNNTINRSKQEVAFYKTYKLYLSDRQNQANAENFTEFVGDIHKALETLEDSMTLYSITTNGSQEFVLNIDNERYVFKFTKNTSLQDGGYALSIYDEYEVLQNSIQCVKPLINLTDCITSSAVFTTNLSEVYIFCPTLDNELTVESENDLSNYYILVTTINMKRWNDYLKNILQIAVTGVYTKYE